MTLRVWLISPAGFLILISAMMLLSPRAALAQFAQQGPLAATRARFRRPISGRRCADRTLET
jgi:hypothetical protein